MLRPLNECDGGEGGEGGAGLEVPAFVGGVRAENSEAVLPGERSILLGSKMEIGIVEALEILRPSGREADLFDDVFEAGALALGHQAQLSDSGRLDGGVDGVECEGLLGNPVQGVEGDDECRIPG